MYNNHSQELTSLSQVFMSSTGAGPPPVPLISFKRAASFFFVALEISCHFFLQSTTSRVISEMLTEFTLKEMLML